MTYIYSLQLRNIVLRLTVSLCDPPKHTYILSIGKTLEFAVLVVKKMDSRSVGDSSSFNLVWEELFEDSPAQAEKRPPDSIPGAVDNRSASVLSKPPNHRYLKTKRPVLAHNEPD